MMTCPLSYNVQVCTGPVGYFKGCVKDGVVMCRLTEGKVAKSLLNIAKPCNPPITFVCPGCDQVMKKEE